MKIIFICGSLEPGCDGVGDYVRRLSGELVRKGYTAAAIALNDNNLTEEFYGIQKADDVDISVLRIPSLWCTKDRFCRAKAWIDKFEPEVLSLQYVPYSFNSKGIPLQLGRRLYELGSSLKWHVMVHEPFIGLQKSFKANLIRIAQILSLRFIKSNLKPYVFHTSIPYYQKVLENIFIKSQLLGLFGNVLINSSNIKVVTYPKNCLSPIIGVYFGSVPPINHQNYFVSKLRSYCLRLDCQFKLIFCGRLGKHGPQFVEAISNAFTNSNCEVIVKGELKSQELSHIFFTSDFGIARVHPRLLGKSGSAIAMLEHGLPLWVPLAEGENISEHFDFRNDLCFTHLTDLIQYSERSGPYNRLPEIAAKLVLDLGLK